MTRQFLQRQMVQRIAQRDVSVRQRLRFLISHDAVARHQFENAHVIRPARQRWLAGGVT